MGLRGETSKTKEMQWIQRNIPLCRWILPVLVIKLSYSKGCNIGEMNVKLNYVLTSSNWYYSSLWVCKHLEINDGCHYSKGNSILM